MKTLKQLYQEELNWFINNKPNNTSLKELEKSATYYANLRFQDQFNKPS